MKTIVNTMTRSKLWLVGLMASLLMLLAMGLVPTYAQENLASTACLETPFDNGCHAGLPIAQYTRLLDEMALNPTPNVDQVPVNEDEVYRFSFRRLNKAGVVTYDTPNGNPIGNVAAGFTFVTTLEYQPGWVKISTTEWVQEGDTTIVQPSLYSGLELNSASLQYELAWMLLPEYPAPYPGAEGDRERPRLERYTPINIFATAEVDGWRWYLVAPETWIKQTSIGKVVLSERPEGVKGRWVSVDLYEQVLVAYDEADNPVYTTLVSSGLEQWSTEEGTFQTWTRLRADAMNGAEGRSDFYSLDFVPWVLYFDGSYALHGAYWHDRFGYRSSRGCVNLSITDSAWIYDWTLEGGYELPWVHIFSSDEYRSPEDVR